MLDETTARLMVDAGAVLVPTLVTYQAMKERGEEFGLPKVNRDKERNDPRGRPRSARDRPPLGVTMGLGTDLLGETQPLQPREPAIRSEVEPPEAILRSMWITALFTMAHRPNHWRHPDSTRSAIATPRSTSRSVVAGADEPPDHVDARAVVRA